MKKTSDLFRKYSQRLLKATGTKYFVVLVVAGVWMIFFDRYNLISRNTVAQQIELLKADKLHYEQSLKDLKHQEYRLQTAGEIERLAREKYFMKKNNEDVYISVPK